MTEQNLVTETSYCKKKIVTETNFCHRKKIYVTETILCQTKKSARKIKFLQDTSFNHRNKFMSEFPSEKHILVKEEGKSFCHRKNSVTKFVLPQKQRDMNLIYQGIVLSSPKGKCLNNKQLFFT